MCHGLYGGPKANLGHVMQAALYRAKQYRYVWWDTHSKTEGDSNMLKLTNEKRDQGPKYESRTGTGTCWVLTDWEHRQKVHNKPTRRAGNTETIMYWWAQVCETDEKHMNRISRKWKAKERVWQYAAFNHSSHVIPNLAFVFSTWKLWGDDPDMLLMLSRTFIIL